MLNGICDRVHPNLNSYNGSSTVKEKPSHVDKLKANQSSSSSALWYGILS